MVFCSNETRRKVIVTRNVLKDEYHNFSGRNVNEGEGLYEFTGATYGCIDYNGGIALSEQPNENPFFEFPLDAIRWEDGP